MSDALLMSLNVIILILLIGIDNKLDKLEYKEFDRKKDDLN